MNKAGIFSTYKGLNFQKHKDLELEECKSPLIVFVLLEVLLN